MTALRWLRITAVAEPLTLLLLLVNLATAHVAAIASLLGPVHGMTYLAGIVLAHNAGLPLRGRVLAWIPAVGAWLATRTTGRTP
jgi:hypothetical protein